MSYSREQRIALSVLRDSLFNIFPQIESQAQFEAITTMDAKIFVSGHLNTSDLPRHQFWTWNQSRARLTISNCGVSGKFFKLSTRTAKYGPKETPRYKLWVYHIHLDGNAVTFLWVEKGELVEQLDATLLAKLSFLTPFVPFSSAAEFGWIDHVLSSYPHLYEISSENSNS